MFLKGDAPGPLRYPVLDVTVRAGVTAPLKRDEVVPGSTEEATGEAHDERIHASMKPKDLSALILLGAVWGLSFIFIRVGVPQLGPFFLMISRVGLAVLALLPFAVALGRLPELRKRWRQFVVMGFLNAAPCPSP